MGRLHEEITFVEGTKGDILGPLPEVKGQQNFNFASSFMTFFFHLYTCFMKANVH